MNVLEPISTVQYELSDADIYGFFQHGVMVELTQAEADKIMKKYDLELVIVNFEGLAINPDSVMRFYANYKCSLYPDENGTVLFKGVPITIRVKLISGVRESSIS